MSRKEITESMREALRNGRAGVANLTHMALRADNAVLRKAPKGYRWVGIVERLESARTTLGFMPSVTATVRFALESDGMRRLPQRDLEGIVRTELGSALGRALDSAVVNGTLGMKAPGAARRRVVYRRGAVVGVEQKTPRGWRWVDPVRDVPIMDGRRRAPVAARVDLLKLAGLGASTRTRAKR